MGRFWILYCGSNLRLLLCQCPAPLPTSSSARVKDAPLPACALLPAGGQCLFGVSSK